MNTGTLRHRAKLLAGERRERVGLVAGDALRRDALALTLRRHRLDLRMPTTKHQWAQSDTWCVTTRWRTGHRVTIHGEDQLLAPEQAVSGRPGVRWFSMVGTQIPWPKGNVFLCAR